ncbi:hypothetical protein [Corynebacterium riegelii]|uniref:Uncharacterized protein n=1 Tax=Corynebacterium riegelii TaxID=156976 RepID=A0A0K1RE05_9CORY|nr:hypothetical protein [Corynebacterium riegelii]AKV59421.1 hypothetical protein AK829_10070 [Corynebacterium riegelii]
MKQYGDTIVNYVADIAQDEFEASTYYKADSVALYTSLPITALVGAILALVLPGQLAMWSLLVLCVPGLSSAAAALWMRNYVPRPVSSLRKMPRGLLVLYFGLVAVWLAIIIITGAYNPEGEFSGAGTIGAIVGAAIGMLVFGALAGKISERRRAKDQARLDATSDD